MHEQRTKIDQLDRQIVEALRERLKLAEEIGKEKRELGLPAFELAREHEVFQRIKDMTENEPRLGALALELYNRIISVSRSLQYEQDR